MHDIARKCPGRAFWFRRECRYLVLSVREILSAPAHDGRRLNSEVPCRLPHAPVLLLHQPDRVSAHLGQMRILCVCHVRHIDTEGVAKLLKHCGHLSAGGPCFVIFYFRPMKVCLYVPSLSMTTSS